MGAIPVYLFDDLWLPYMGELNWRRLGVLVHVDEIAFLPEILDAIAPDAIAAMQAAIPGAVARYFTFDACVQWILRTVQAIGRGELARERVGRSAHEARFHSLWANANLGHLRRRNPT